MSPGGPKIWIGTSRPRSAKVFGIPGSPRVVIGVVVREEDLAQVDQPDRGPQRAGAASLAAVEEQAVAPRRTRIALGARFAVGIEPAVPKKTRSRSTREGYARPVPGDDVRELLRRE